MAARPGSREANRLRDPARVSCWRLGTRGSKPPGAPNKASQYSSATECTPRFQHRLRPVTRYVFLPLLIICQPAARPSGIELDYSKLGQCIVRPFASPLRLESTVAEPAARRLLTRLRSELTVVESAARKLLTDRG